MRAASTKHSAVVALVMSSGAIDAQSAAALSGATTSAAALSGATKSAAALSGATRRVAAMRVAAK